MRNHFMLLVWSKISVTSLTARYMHHVLLIPKNIKPHRQIQFSIISVFCQTQPTLPLYKSAPSISCHIEGCENAQPFHIHPTMCAETDTFQHSLQLISKSQSCTMNSTQQYLRTRMYISFRKVSCSKTKQPSSLYPSLMAPMVLIREYG